MVLVLLDDNNPINSDALGLCQIPLKSLLTNEVKHEIFEIKKQSEIVGSLEIKLSCQDVVLT